MSAGGRSGLKAFLGPLFGPVGMVLLPFVFVGGVALVVGAKEGFDQWRFRRAAVHTHGVVVGYERAAGSRGSTYHPLVQYQAPSGMTTQFRSHFAYPKAEYPLDQPVDVIYDPANPQQAEVDSNQSRYRVWLLPAFAVIAAVVALTFYTVGFVIYRVTARKAAAEGIPQS